ncbi:MAG: MGMT family protein [Anaerolineales bacterium]|jgi:methylated-DNA-protein-cysteine methyltransferase-like protein
MRFTSPPDPINFNQQVWDIVRRVPPGRVTTYGEIARRLPLPEGMDPKAYLAFAPRWVGGAMAACPADVPWQRVINSKGEISARPGARMQHQLLEEEGVQFNERGRIDLTIFGWPDSAGEQEQPHLL